MAGEGARLSETGRVEAFSDAVVAIALTLLVLDLIAPHERGRLAEDLLREWPAYLAYLTAFLTIASIWVSHHAVFSRLARVDPVVLTLNLLLLLGVALVPWPTALLAAALSEGGGARDLADQRAAIVVYVAVSLVVALGWAAMSGAILRRPHLFAADRDVAWVRRNARQSLLAAPIAIIGGAAGLLVPVVALAVFLLVPVGFLSSALLGARKRS